MDIKKYFKRIGLSKDTEISYTYDFLKNIQFCHVMSVPYENLDILDGKPLSLNAEDVYDKVVNRRRGGYCFELNCLLSALLKELGFEVESYLARFWRNETSIPVRRHRIIAVQCEQDTYICDVGMGQSAPRYPLKLEEGTLQKQFGETYKFEKDDFHGWVLYDLHKGEWRRFYSFTEDRQLDVDFIAPSFYCEMHPKSLFNKSVMVAIKTKEGRKTISDREYKEFKGDNPILIESNLNDERRKELLLKEFGIDWRAKC